MTAIHKGIVITGSTEHAKAGGLFQTIETVSEKVGQSVLDELIEREEQGTYQFKDKPNFFPRLKNTKT
jgi:hypothetical protein